jgi:hypothetical protein
VTPLPEPILVIGEEVTKVRNVTFDLRSVPILVIGAV